MAQRIALGAVVALLAASATGAAVIAGSSVAAPPVGSEGLSLDLSADAVWVIDSDQPSIYTADVWFTEIAALGLVPLVPVATAEAGGGGPVAPPPPAPLDPLTIMLDRLVALEGEWVRPVWDCITWMESKHGQFVDGPTRDRGFAQITDFWWYGGFARIGHPELDRVDPYDPLNQANGADAIWQHNGQSWRGQWASARSCGVG